MTSAPPRPRRTWDRVLTIVLMVLLLPWSVLMLVFGVLAGMQIDACTGTCTSGAIDLGLAVGTVGQLVVVLAAVVGASLALQRGRIAFWIPVVAATVSIGLVALDSGLVQYGVASGSS